MQAKFVTNRARISTPGNPAHEIDALPATGKYRWVAYRNSDLVTGAALIRAELPSSRSLRFSRLVLPFDHEDGFYWDLPGSHEAPVRRATRYHSSRVKEADAPFPGRQRAFLDLILDEVRPAIEASLCGLNGGRVTPQQLSRFPAAVAEPLRAADARAYGAGTFEIPARAIRDAIGALR